ncbi:MerR family transcriptional regulator [Peribacillus sp. SCS-155]|uniref:MerR family transcriptional regulator n=1 Tax=Peribacillus sedimenti TaxID=3115297 RepID=UPI00390576CC
MQAGKYNIKAVSKLLGIQPGTLRAWERRYQIIAPVRNESGHRLYTEDHVKTLKWLTNKINQGFTISQAVNLLESSSNHQNEDEINTDIEGDQTAQLAAAILESLLQFNETKAHMLLNQAFSFYTIEKAVTDIVGSILVQIGHLWESGKITSAHEHFATSILRARISFIMHTIPANNLLPKAVAVCAPGEWHELGLIIFTIFLRRKGMEVIYLGPSIAEEDVHVVIDTVKPGFVFFSCTLRESLGRVSEWLSNHAYQYPDVEFGIGGSSIDGDSLKRYSVDDSYFVGNTEREWREWLRIYGY